MRKGRVPSLRRAGTRPARSRQAIPTGSPGLRIIAFRCTEQLQLGDHRQDQRAGACAAVERVRNRLLDPLRQEAMLW